MKILLAIGSIIIFSGCASLNTAPKENVKEVFSAVKSRKYEIAQMVYNNSPGSKFSVFEGGGTVFESVDSTEIKKLLDGSSSYLMTCDDLISKAKQLRSGIKIEDDGGSNDEPNTLSGLKESFQTECELVGKEYFKSELIKIKKYSTIDILAELSSLKKAFYGEVAKMELMAQREEKAGETAASLHEKKKADYENSPNFYSKKLCEMDDRIMVAKNIINSENEAGKLSGYVDKNKLYEAGKMIQINQNRIKHFAGEYKSKFGKPWSPTECK